MNQKFYVLFLILGLTVATSKHEEILTTARRVPQSVAPTPPSLGIYSLANGTEGCPKEIEWNMECRGYSIKITSTNEIQHFCNINQGASVIQEKMEYGMKKEISMATLKENIIRKSHFTVMSNKSNSATLKQDDTILIDDTGKFLWEHSVNGKGFSCLYAK